jgi:ATP-dependent helicase/nuclease subunit A
MGLSGWQAFYARLGMDSIDPLEELLSFAMRYDQDSPDGGVQGFISMMANNTSDIKRELDNDHNQVRIMTVHASKGLQAPIVICPDSTSLPTYSLKSDKGFIFTEEGTALWPSSKQDHCEAIENYKSYASKRAYEEYCRLLYVAMTRAEDHLIICGALNKRQSDVADESWYGLVYQGMKKIGAMDHEWGHDESYMNPDNNSFLIYEAGQPYKADKMSDKKQERSVLPLADWAQQSFEPERKSSRILRPSQDYDDVHVAYSPLSRMDDTYRFKRGNLTHTLLQYLPDMDIHERYDKGTIYLDKHASDLPDDVKDSILNEVIAILSSDDFAPFFGQGSLAEVSITGIVHNDNGTTDVISGQIDRLLVTESEVWIVDFKSNRPPPKDPAKIPVQYRQQLAAYKTVIADMYPDHAIRCALLWTDGPFMMELKDV